MESEESVAAVENPGKPGVGSEEPKGNGAVELQRAANRMSLERAPEIVGALLKSALEGRIQSIRFLFQLAQGGEEDAEMDGKPKLRERLAAEWEADKKWLADMASENAKAMVSRSKVV